MKSVIRAGGLCCSVGAMLLVGSLWAQDTKKPEGPPTATKKAGTRLPDYFNRLSLTDEQKKKVAAVQAANAAKLDELRAQLKAAQEKQQAELDAVLTPEQLKLLGSIREESKKKQAEAKALKAKEAEKKAAAEPEKKPEAAKKPEAEKKPATDKKS